MVSTNTYIYTDNGIFKIDDLFEIYKDDTITNKPKVMTIDTTNFVYTFTDQYRMTKVPEDITDVNISINNFNQIFECKFTDIFSDRIITCNVTEDTYILQYNVLKTDDNPIYEKNYGVLQYLQSNRNKKKIDIGWKPIKNLLNYSTHMPNICLGDTITKFISKEVRNKEISYEVYDNRANGIETLPIFICQNISVFYNFILIKGKNE